jgi:NTP pyrophosphatase (non-canonical NTP hydrolase)
LAITAPAAYHVAMEQPATAALTLRALQHSIQATFGAKDAARGDTGTFLWLTEEIGELGSALRAGLDEAVAAEMADVLAWVATLANVRGIDLERAFQAKYGEACPSCHRRPCTCDPRIKP